MIGDRLGLVRAALATQTEWKFSLNASGSWTLEKRPLRPSYSRGVEVESEALEIFPDPTTAFTYIIL